MDTLDHGTFVLAERSPDTFTMLVFYRGLHCPVCRSYLAELSGMLDEFRARGVEVIALSGDAEDKARQARDTWELGTITVGYGLSETAMNAWGLFVSAAIRDGEPDRFNEPGLFLVDPQGATFYVAVNSMPFGRPVLSDMLHAVDFVRAKDYPARGEVDPG